MFSPTCTVQKKIFVSKDLVEAMTNFYCTVNKSKYDFQGAALAYCLKMFHCELSTLKRPYFFLLKFQSKLLEGQKSH